MTYYIAINQDTGVELTSEHTDMGSACIDMMIQLGYEIVEESEDD